ncbi:MAG TPA: endo-1,4-beta-xylanase [Clostridia bacterium]|nr:endo-1,4-beta-xylanase [Clostridia bacterium]
MAMALVFAYSPVIGAESVEIYHETFANGTGIAAQSGGASLTQVSGKTFDGNSDGKALYVSKRTNNWDAADFKFTDLKLENGKTYSITVKGYVDSGVNIPSGAQAALQTADGYAWISGVNMEAGKAFTLTGTYKVGSNEKDTRFRVQSDEKGKTVPFYIGDIVITTDKAAAASTGASSGAAASAGTGASVSAPAAKEIYHETFASGVGAAKQSGGASLAQVTGKTFDGNSDGKALYVSKRTNNWDAADFNFTDVGMKDGKTYNITVKGYIDSDATIPTGAQAALQTADGYAWISGVNMEAGKAFTLTGKYTVGSNKSDTRLRIQSNDAGKAVSFYVGDIAITEDASSTGTSTTGSGNAASTAEKFTTITFEDQKADGFVGRAGTEKLTVTKEANHTDGGAYALKVEGRKETWHGPAMRVEKYVDQGSEYKITAWVKLIDPASSQLQLSTQVGDGSGASYNNLNAKAVSSSDGWVELTGTFRYNNTSSNFITIYVESPSSATASYYIDDISFENTGSAPISIQKDLKAIKDAYKNSFLIGNAISAEDLEGIRLEMLKKHFNVVTAGNAMKPDALQNVKGKFTFDAADKMIKQAADAGLKVHGHVLAWHQQSPAWLNTKTDAKGNTVKLSRTEALANLRTHIKTVMEHFGNKVISWDVVNEAMNDNPSNPADYKASLRKTPWYDAIGPDYVEQAFLAAREVLDKHPSWKIRLYYNDYNEDNQNKATAIYNMVKDINARYARTHHGKLLIDGIGMQAHYSISTNPTNVELSLKKFISLGVKVSITELDIMTGNNYELSDQLATAQGYLYAELLKLFKANAKYIERVTFWGADDGTSWRSSQNPTPFDKNLQAKPAYYGVIDPDKFMAENKPAAAEGAKQSTAKFGTPVIDGKIDVVWKNAPELPINRYQMAWQGASGTAKVLWDNKYLYVLYQVNDAQLDKKSANPWEQDSVEAFLDENNGKTTFYQGDDGQYRVNYSNTTSFNPASISKNFKSATKVSGTNYVVEMRIPFKTVKPKANMKIGFDAQINDGKDGARQSVATWNDTTGNAYQDTSVYGVITLKK